MKAEQVFEVLEKLIGEIDPIADSSVDAKRMENMQVYVDVFWKMQDKLYWIAQRHSDSPYASQKAVANVAKKTLDLIKTEFSPTE